MKKYISALALLTLLPMVSVTAYGYESYYRPSAKTNSNTYRKVNTSRRTGSSVTNNFYYTGNAQNASVAQPRSYESNARAYSGGNYYTVKQSGKKQTRTVKKSYTTQERKFFLANPFFQPLKGHVGSVTDLGYAQNKFNFDIMEGTILDIDKNPPLFVGYGDAGISGKATTTQFTVKEDLSYGLTDSLSLVLMAQYDKTKIKFSEWSIPESDMTYSDSGLNLFGVGLQNRFVDSDEWIVMGEAFFQHQKDTANTLIGTVKAGYKVYRTTIYGIGRIAYTNLTKNDIYGVYSEGTDGDWLMLSYNSNVKNIFQAEGGLGAFAVLNKYFTLNGEATFGHYDWHNQLNIKGAIGWQPADMFALNLYASTAIYDSAKSKIRNFYNYDVNPVTTDFPAASQDSKLAYTYGDYKIKDYNEWKIGVQAILHF